MRREAERQQRKRAHRDAPLQRGTVMTIAGDATTLVVAGLRARPRTEDGPERTVMACCNDRIAPTLGGTGMPARRRQHCNVGSSWNMVHFTRNSCGWVLLLQMMTGVSLFGHGQKNGEGVAASLPRKERRTLWKAARFTSTTHPNACHRFPMASVFACDHVVNRGHVGHGQWLREIVGNDYGAREGRPPLPTPARRGGHCVVSECK